MLGTTNSCRIRSQGVDGNNGDGGSGANCDTLTLVAPWHNLMCVPATLGEITEIQTWQVTVDGVNHGVFFD
jgi:hypothetical protein